jgi:hypothetical protein
MKFEKEINKTKQGSQVIYRFKSKRILLSTFPLPKDSIHGNNILAIQHFHNHVWVCFRAIKGLRVINFQVLNNKTLRGERICGEFCRKHGVKQDGEQ